MVDRVWAILGLSLLRQIKKESEVRVGGKSGSPYIGVKGPGLREGEAGEEKSLFQLELPGQEKERESHGWYRR